VRMKTIPRRLGAGPRRLGVGIAAIAAAILLTFSLAAPALAHEERTVGAYAIEVGFIAEPVYVGERSGLEIHVTKAEKPVEGLETTLKAEVVFGTQQRHLTLSAREEDPGWYESVFIPTAAGKYTFHLTGTIEGQAVDQSFTSSPTGFDEVDEAASGQFPNVLETTTEIAADAQKGADAAGQLPLAIGLGAAGAVLGLVALAVSVAGRRRPA
jgi:hypothetical protein